jgi:hypothetical protein
MLPGVYMKQGEKIRTWRRRSVETTNKQLIKQKIMGGVSRREDEANP